MRVIYFEKPTTPCVEVIIDGTGDQLYNGAPKHYIGLSDGIHNMGIELTAEEALAIRFAGVLQLIDMKDVERPA